MKMIKVELDKEDLEFICLGLYCYMQTSYKSLKRESQETVRMTLRKMEEARKRQESETTKETIICPDCGLEIKYDVNKLGAVVETWVPGACPRCGVCLK